MAAEPPLGVTATQQEPPSATGQLILNWAHPTPTGAAAAPEDGRSHKRSSPWPGHRGDTAELGHHPPTPLLGGQQWEMGNRMGKDGVGKKSHSWAPGCVHVQKLKKVGGIFPVISYLFLFIYLLFLPIHFPVILPIYFLCFNLFISM